MTIRRVYGTIEDTSGFPARGARVDCEPGGWDFDGEIGIAPKMVTTWTDQVGHFELDLRDGTYTVTVTAKTRTYDTFEITSPGGAGEFMAAASAPAAFAAGDWDLNPAESIAGDNLVVTLNSLPADNGSRVVAVEYTADGGSSWAALPDVELTSYTITVPTAGVSTDVQLRAVNAVGESPAPDTKSETPAYEAPEIVEAPTIGDAPIIGDTVTGDPGEWSGSPTLTYQWKLDGADIAGETGTTYSPEAADDGGVLTFAVTADNNGATTTVETAGQAVTYAAPGAAQQLADISFTQDTGVKTVDVSGDFTGAVGGTWSLPTAPAGVTIDQSGVLSIDTTAGVFADQSVVVRYTNSGGAADSGLSLTIAAAADTTPPALSLDDLTATASSITATVSTDEAGQQIKVVVLPAGSPTPSSVNAIFTEQVSDAVTYAALAGGSVVAGPNDVVAAASIQEATAYKVAVAQRDPAGNGAIVSGIVTTGTTTTKPEAFTDGQWGLANQPSVAGDKLDITIAALPDNGGSVITDIEYRVDSGSGYGAWTSLGTTSTGTKTITVLSETQADVQIRAVNAIDPADPSDTKTATPTVTTTTLQIDSATYTPGSGGNGPTLDVTVLQDPNDDQITIYAATGPAGAVISEANLEAESGGDILEAFSFDAQNSPFQTDLANENADELHILAVNSGGVKTAITVLTGIVVDATAPVLSNGTAAADGTDSGTASVDTDTGEGVLRLVATTSPTQPTVQQVEAGQDHTGAQGADSIGSAVTATGPQTVAFEELDPDTTYHVWAVQTDDVGNKTDVFAVGNFTTDALATVTSYPTITAVAAENWKTVTPATTPTTSEIVIAVVATRNDAEPNASSSDGAIQATVRSDGNGGAHAIAMSLGQGDGSQQTWELIWDNTSSLYRSAGAVLSDEGKTFAKIAEASSTTDTKDISVSASTGDAQPARAIVAVSWQRQNSGDAGTWSTPAGWTKLTDSTGNPEDSPPSLALFTKELPSGGTANFDSSADANASVKGRALMMIFRGT